MSTDLPAVADFAARVQMHAEDMRDEVARHEGARERVAAALAEAEARVQETGNEAEVLDAVLGLLQGMEGAFQRNFQRSLATVVSEGLSQVFGEELEVRIEASTRADMSAIRFVLIKKEDAEKGIEEDIMTGQGGGIVQVIAFLLRVLLILAARPLLRRLLVLDEPFPMVSPEYRPALAEMVKALIDQLDFQMIMVTQEREFASYADRAYFFEMHKGLTTIRDFGGGTGQTDA